MLICLLIKCEVKYLFVVQGHAQTILMATCSFDKTFMMLREVSIAIQALWQDRGVRLAVARGYEYELNDSAI